MRIPFVALLSSASAQESTLKLRRQDLINNGLAASTDDWEMQHSEDFGLPFGLIFNQILVGGANSAALPPVRFGGWDATEIFRGVSDGFFMGQGVHRRQRPL